ESATPARFESDSSGRRTAAGLEVQTARGGRIGQRDREDADVASATLPRGNACELAQELGVVLIVGRTGPRVAPRANAGGATERLDLDPGVVGEGGQSRRPRREPRLDPGVGLEGQAVLDGLAGDAELVERDEAGVLEVQELPQLAQLVR